MKVSLVTDDSSYFTKEEADNLNLSIVKLKVILPDGKIVTQDELNWKEYFESLKTVKKLPTTSQPSVGDFEFVYKNLLSQGVENILSIHISSGISGTIQSAMLAKNILSYDGINVFDSWYTACGLRFQVEEAYRLLQEGATLKEVIHYLEYMRDNTKILFLVDTLEYLQKGGRIGGAQALIGSLLQIKPILSIKKVVEPYDKVRTKDKAFIRLIEEVKKGIDEAPDNYKLALVHVNALDSAIQLKEQLKDVKIDIPIWEIGPVIGTHVGPGTIGFGLTYVK